MSVTSDSVLLIKGLFPCTQSSQDRPAIGRETFSVLISLPWFLPCFDESCFLSWRLRISTEIVCFSLTEIECA